MFGKENTVFTDSKDRQVKHYYPAKKAVTLRIDVGVLTIETFLIERPV